MMIDETGCPRCGIRRIGNLGTWGRYCFNCRAHLPDRGLRPDSAWSEPGYQFRGDELVRLESYRAAIQAGFFTDWPRDAAVLNG